MPSQSNFYQLTYLMTLNHDGRWVGCNDEDNSCLALVEGTDRGNDNVNIWREVFEANRCSKKNEKKAHTFKS